MKVVKEVNKIKIIVSKKIPLRKAKGYFFFRKGYFYCTYKCLPL
jgi:hypothetical protein